MTIYGNSVRIGYARVSTRTLDHQAQLDAVGDRDRPPHEDRPVHVVPGTAICCGVGGYGQHPGPRQGRTR